MDTYAPLIYVDGSDRKIVGDPRVPSLTARVTTLESASPGSSTSGTSPALLAVQGILDRADVQPVQIYVGGSSTALGGASTGTKRFADRLLASLQKAHPSGGAETAVQYSSWTTDTGNGVHMYNYATSGSSAASYSAASRIVARSAQIAIHMIGSNDLLAGTTAGEYETIMRNMLAACDSTVTFPVVHVLGHHGPRLIWADSTWDTYRDALARIAADRPDDTVLVDAGATFQVMRRNGDTSGYDADGVHMNDAGNATLGGIFARAFLAST